MNAALTWTDAGVLLAFGALIVLAIWANLRAGGRS